MLFVILVAPVAIESLCQLTCEEDNKNISPLLEKVCRTFSSFNLCPSLQPVATGNRRQATDDRRQATGEKLMP